MLPSSSSLVLGMPLQPQSAIGQMPSLVSTGFPQMVIPQAPLVGTQGIQTMAPQSSGNGLIAPAVFMGQQVYQANASGMHIPAGAHLGALPQPDFLPQGVASSDIALAGLSASTPSSLISPQPLTLAVPSS